MSELQTIKVPDIGDYADVDVIEVLVSRGDTISVEDSLITIESDKASMEIPSPVAGVVTAVLVKTGQQVSQGTDIVVVDVASAATAADRPAPSASTPAPSAEAARAAADSTISQAARHDGPVDIEADLVVLGSGPGGYTAAFRAADLGRKVLLIERYASLGGVCLNVGCIPSKALLHTAAVITESREMADSGVSFGPPTLDIDKIRAHKDNIVGQLTGGLTGLARQRKVEVLQGSAAFSSPNTLEVDTPEGMKVVSFQQAIIAVGSHSIRIPGFPYEDERLIDSTGALALREVPQNLLIIGGGIIGLEMGCVYSALGSEVTVVELSDGLIPGADKDLIRPLHKRLKQRFANIYLSSRVTDIESSSEGLKVSFDGEQAPPEGVWDSVLLAVGRTPNGRSINAELAGVSVDERGFIAVDKQQRTNVEHIFAIGDVVGQPMLAHKATHEAKTAAEVACGMKSWFDARTIPSVAYTDPEVAWMGLTETEAKANGTAYEKAAFPWAASGRALSLGRSEGMTKILYDPDSHQILGAGMTGPNAGELIAEAVLALEMGADIQDVALTIHPHPTLSETFNFACEVAEGTITDIMPPRKRQGGGRKT